MLEIKKPTYFYFYALKKDTSLFCYRDIPTIHNGYCVSNAVDYAKKNDVLPTMLSTEVRGQYNTFLTLVQNHLLGKQLLQNYVFGKLYGS